MFKKYLFIILAIVGTCGLATALTYLNDYDSVKYFSSNYQLNEIGRSVLNRPIYTLSVGGTRKIFVVTRQHGTEFYGSYVARGLVKEAALTNCVFDIVVNANPDGANNKTRTNSLGFDLNRIWNVDNDYEVGYLKEFAKNSDYDVYLDLHGYNGNEMTNDILVRDSASLTYCKNHPVTNFLCKDISSWNIAGNFEDYFKVKGLTFGIEYRQKTWTNATIADLELIGRRLARFACV